MIRFGKWAYDPRTKTLSHSESAWKRSLKNITHSHSSGFSTVSLPASVSIYRLKLPRHQTPNPVGVVPLAQGIALGSDSRRSQTQANLPCHGAAIFPSGFAFPSCTSCLRGKPPAFRQQTRPAHPGDRPTKTQKGTNNPSRRGRVWVGAISTL